MKGLLLWGEAKGGMGWINFTIRGAAPGLTSIISLATYVVPIRLAELLQKIVETERFAPLGTKRFVKYSRYIRMELVHCLQNARPRRGAPFLSQKTIHTTQSVTA